MNIKTTLSVLGLALGLSLAAPAQQANQYQLIPYGNGSVWFPSKTTNLVQTTTATNQYQIPSLASTNATFGQMIAGNTNLISLPVSEFNDAGVTFAFTGTSGSTNTLTIYASFDTAQSYSLVPIWSSVAGIAPGAALFLTNFDVSCTGATALAFQISNTGTSYATNAELTVNLKSQKYGAKAATQ